MKTCKNYLFTNKTESCKDLCLINLILFNVFTESQQQSSGNNRFIVVFMKKFLLEIVR